MQYAPTIGRRDLLPEPASHGLRAAQYPPLTASRQTASHGDAAELCLRAPSEWHQLILRGDVSPAPLRHHYAPLVCCVRRSIAALALVLAAGDDSGAGPAGAASRTVCR